LCTKLALFTRILFKVYGQFHWLNAKAVLHRMKCSLIITDKECSQYVCLVANGVLSEGNITNYAKIEKLLTYWKSIDIPTHMNRI